MTKQPEDMMIGVKTSCGNVFYERAGDMSDRQISGLIDQNPDHAITPTLKVILARREEARVRRLAAAKPVLAPWKDPAFRVA